jgi:copper chaperone CopZ
MNLSVHLFTLIFLTVATGLSAQTDTVRIQTSSVCETCKKTIEHELSFEKGIKTARLDVETGILTVIYNSAKTDPAAIRIAVTKTGYDADSLKADPKSFNKLPDCCRDPGKHH